MIFFRARSERKRSDFSEKKESRFFLRRREKIEVKDDAISCSEQCLRWWTDQYYDEICRCMMIYLDLSAKKYVDVAGPDRFWSFLRRIGLTTIIIQRQDLMINWFDDKNDELFKNTYIIFFESRFISNKIALKFLKHYIQNSDVDSTAERKLMLMNNHESHMIFEFIVFANENHMRSFSLIFYLTHCMQLFNVKIFQYYKHWHDQII
jgi:hypothetical protein